MAMYVEYKRIYFSHMFQIFMEGVELYIYIYIYIYI